MKLEIQHWTPAAIVYRRRTGAYGPDNQVEITELKRWSQERGLMTPQTVILGIAHDDPSITTASECRYDAAITISTGARMRENELGTGYVEGLLDGGTYAVAVIDHTAEGLERGWAEIVPAAIQAGFDIDPSRPIIERYAAARLEQDECELCLPIA